MTIHSIAPILEDIKTAGRIGLDGQKDGSLVRAFKSDGSVVTAIDKKLDSFLSGCVERLWPQANLLTEEAPHPFDPQKAYTFAIDPIDGTDVYSQGMPGWCVSIGLLDKKMQPIAGVIYAPSMDLLLFADVAQCAVLNGKPVSIPAALDPLSEESNLMVSSRVHHRIELSRFPGKIRNIGSAALHLSFPLIYPAIFGAIQSPEVKVYDIAAAFALITSLGFEMSCLDGSPINWSAMAEEGKARDMIISCAPQRAAELRASLPRLA